MTDTHRHDWAHAPTQPAPPIRWACDQCTELTTGCQDCDWPLTTSLTICDRCLTKAKRILDDIADIIAQIPDPHATIMGLRPMGRFDQSASANDPGRLPFGLDAVYDDPQTPGLVGIRTPRGLLEVLTDWADDWADILGQPWTGNVLDWLTEHTLWAAQNHPAWADYLWSARQVRAHARRLAGLDPVREPVPCVHCGGRITRRWTDHGLDDTRECQTCGLTWPDEARLAYANLTALRILPDTHPDQLVTADDAKAVYRGRIRPNLIDLWIHRERLTPTGRDVRGRPTYRLADVAQLAENALRDTPNHTGS